MNDCEKKDTEVFDGIYSIVERRLAAKGLKPACSRDTFMTVRNLRLEELDMAELGRLDNNSFVDAVFMTLWCRPPSADEKKEWKEDIAAMAPQDFQRKFIGWVSSMRKDLSPDKPSTIDILLNKTYNQVYLKTPEPFQKFVRTHFKKG